MSGPPIETQPERTVLSWQRTALGVLAVAGLIGHGAFLDGDPRLLLLGGAVALLGLALLGAVAPLRYRRLRRTLGDRGAASSPALAALATLVVLAAAAAALTAIVSR